MNKLKKIIDRWVILADSEDEPRGFIHMVTPKRRMELRADFNNYDDLIRAVKAIKEEARILYKEKYREEDFS